VNHTARVSERRQVSVLFTDMVGYTAIVERLGEERAATFTRMIYDRLSEAVLRHGGTIKSFAGDSVMAVFGIPDAQEDAALRACRAALSIQTSFAAEGGRIEAEYGVRPAMRAGVSSGVIVLAAIEGEGTQMTAVGSTVNLASRIQALAQAGGCLICDATRRLVEWFAEVSFDAEHAIKGVSKVQKLWRLVALHDGATRFDVSLARGLSDLVGRQQELALLSGALEASRNGLRVVDIVAEPGQGKTRLAFEFLQRAAPQGVFVLRGNCSADGRKVPFFPFLEVVRGSFRINADDEPDEIAEKLETGLRGAGLFSAENLGLLLNFLGLRPPEGALSGLDGVLIGLRTRDLLPALLAARCRTGQVLLKIEDIHWIDGASEDLLRSLIAAGDLPNLLVITTRRHEYLPPWHPDPGVERLALGPLATDEILRLAQARLGAEALPEALMRQITERAAGNPLFGEEILGFLIQQGALRVEAGRVEFDADLGAQGLPASIESLLIARMDRLPRQDRALLQAAAAIGRRFDPGLLAEVADRPDDTGAALQHLQEQDIVRREPDSSDFVFKHVLLRDSVYHGLLTDSRSALHLAIAEALERRSADRLPEVAETLAYHYGQTPRSDRAFHYSALAGTKGLGVFSLAEANQYFDAAFALWERDPACASPEQFAAFLADYALCLNISLRVKPLLELADRVLPILARNGDSRHHVLFLHHYIACLVCNGRYPDALDVQGDLSAMAGRLGDPVSVGYALVSQLALSCYIAPFPAEAFEARRRETEAVLAQVDDAYLHNYFWANLGWDKICRGRVADANRAADRLMEAGIAKNDPRSLGYGMAMKALTAMCTDDYETALAMSEQALAVSRVEFESAIAAASRHSSLVPLNKPGAAREVRQFVDGCFQKGWVLFASGPNTMLGVALAMEGQIDAGLKHLETVIARSDERGAVNEANWNRLFLCEVYLGILSGKGGASPAVLLRNAGALARVFLFGPRKITELVAQVRATPSFDPEGHYIARSELILGMLCKIRKNRPQAIRHLTEALRIIEPSGPSAMQTRITEALAELTATRK
jgi:class 3 adenylate cyclase/tetratricopeptide (TPR) repeat protein